MKDQKDTTTPDCPKIIRDKIRRFRHFAIIYYWSSIICLPFAIVAFVKPSLGIVIFGLSVTLRILSINVAKNHDCLRKIAENPKIVYWGHPTYQPDKPLNESIHLKLHLRDGTEVEMVATGSVGVVAIGPKKEQLQEVVAWLRYHNPSMKWGNYDTPIPEK